MPGCRGCTSGECRPASARAPGCRPEPHKRGRRRWRDAADKASSECPPAFAEAARPEDGPAVASLVPLALRLAPGGRTAKRRTVNLTANFRFGRIAELYPQTVEVDV